MSQHAPDSLKPCLNLYPRRVRAITERLALRLVFGSEGLDQFSRRKQGVAFSEAHPVGIEIAFFEMGPADLVVILLYGGVFTRLQHGDHVRLRRQLKEVVVVPRIGSK